MATELIIKLVIAKDSDKVLFAEAGEDVIDLLFSFLAFPIGAVVKLLSHTSMPGSLGNLYNSVQTLNDSHINAQYKSLLLQPKLASLPPGCDKPLLLNDDDPSFTQFYKCSDWFCASPCFSDLRGTPCGGCNHKMVTAVKYVAPCNNISGSDGAGEFVKSVISYMIMDDLSVSPVSTVFSISLFSKLGIKDLSTLEERVVKMGQSEALALLKLSFQSKTVLTDVFIKGKRLLIERPFSSFPSLHR